MRLKIWLPLLAALGAAAFAGFRIAGDRADRRDQIGVRAAADDGDAGPGLRRRQEDAADLSRLSRPHRGDPRHFAAGARLRLHRCAARGRRRRRQGRRPALQDRPARPAGRARSGARAGAARPGLARICEGEFLARRGADEERLCHQGRVRPDAPARCAAEARWRSTTRRSTRRHSTSAMPKSARRSPAGSGATRRERRARRPRDRRAQHAGPARSRLCHLQSERIGPGRDREGARRRQGRGGNLAHGRIGSDRARANSPSSTTPSTRRPARSSRASRSPIRISRCCRANMCGCGCSSATSPTR